MPITFTKQIPENCRELLKVVRVTVPLKAKAV